MKRLSLPKGDDVAIEINPSIRSQSVYNREDPLAGMSSPQEVDEEPIVVPDRLSSPHSLTRQSSEILTGLQSNELGLVNPQKSGCLDITVSKDSLRRALRNMDTVIKTLEKRGYSVYLSEGRTRTKILEVPISFGISEKLVTRKKRPEEHDLSGSYTFGHSRFVDERAPSGELRLTIHDAENFYIYGCQQHWSDGKKAKLENRIGNGVETRVLKQAVRRNRNRFPSDFMFELTKEENRSLRSQNVILEPARYSKYLPFAFTEQRVAMLSSILNSERAVEGNIAIMRVFVRLREMMATHKELAFKLVELEERLEGHDEQIQNIFEAIRQLMTPPERARKKIYPVKLKLAA